MSSIYTNEQKESFTNPIIWADIPDPDVIRVGNVYYMSSTTMHFNPGVPIMKSDNLVNWEIVNYVYDILAESDEQLLKNKQNEYGKGSWASSLRFHQGTFYIAFASYTTGKTYIYQTEDIEGNSWRHATLHDVYHDMSLLFDDDGHVYMIYGSGDIKIIELNAEATAIKEDGLQKTIIYDASKVIPTKITLPAEGAHLHKINGKYYIFLITWPEGGERTEIVYRADTIDGEYEGKIVYDDVKYTGTAQGGVIDTVDGSWYAMLFRDSGAVGRIPYLIPVTWKDNWPVFGENSTIPDNMPIPVTGMRAKNYVVDSDEFESDNAHLALVWQWNHNPDNRNWSLTERLGYLRLINGKLSLNIEEATNTLTQRTFGPECSGNIAMDIKQMKNGDVAGLAALQKDYGYVAVKMADGVKSIIMVNADSGIEEEIESIPIVQEQVYFKIDFDFKNQIDRAYFYYSLDGTKWYSIGNTLQMHYKLDHFVGYRFALFNYAIEAIGGYVDFAYFRIENTIQGR